MQINQTLIKETCNKQRDAQYIHQHSASEADNIYSALPECYKQRDGQREREREKHTVDFICLSDSSEGEFVSTC